MDNKNSHDVEVSFQHYDVIFLLSVRLYGEAMSSLVSITSIYYEWNVGRICVTRIPNK